MLIIFRKGQPTLPPLPRYGAANMHLKWSKYALKNTKYALKMQVCKCITIRTLVIMNDSLLERTNLSGRSQTVCHDKV